MKIATWNVAYGTSPTKNARILALMKEVDADIWVLTETHDQLCPPTSDSWCATNSDDRPQDSRRVTKGSRWCTIWTRYPVIDELRPNHDPIRTAACVIGTPLGKLLVFGTVLPWYRDLGRTVAYEIAMQSEDWLAMSSSHDNISTCVAGDFNVNLGGDHYYGTNEGKFAVRRILDDQDLVTLTDFEHTGAVQFERFGLIDHIAVSEPIAGLAGPPEVWNRRNEGGETMSDHCGVAIEFLESPSLASDVTLN